METSDRLRLRMAMTNGHLVRSLDALWSSPDIARLFPEYLILLHQVIRASVPLMEAARSEALKLPIGDPLRDPLASYFQHHINEERDHDDWTLEDLCAAGFSKDEILNRIPLPTTAAFVGSIIGSIIISRLGCLAITSYWRAIPEPPWYTMTSNA